MVLGAGSVVVRPEGGGRCRTLLLLDAVPALPTLPAFTWVGPAWGHRWLLQRLLPLRHRQVARSYQTFLLGYSGSLRMDPSDGSGPCSVYHLCLVSIARGMFAINSHALPLRVWQ